MDSHDQGHDRMLQDFLAGELDPADVSRWDEHLLGCELCWRAVREDRDARRAVQLLRKPALPWLSERIRFAVEVAAAPQAGSDPPSGHGGLLSRARLAIAAVALVAVIAGAVLLPGLLVGGRAPGRARLPAAVSVVADYARAIPPGPRTQMPGERLRSAPVLVGRRVMVLPGHQRIVLSAWRVDGVTAVAAVSSRYFPMPGGARRISGQGMAWLARLGNLRLYCINGRPSELVAARVPEATLALLAASLPA